MPKTPVACGGGPAGGAFGGPAFVASPTWVKQNGEVPSQLIFAPHDPELTFYLRYSTQPPPVGIFDAKSAKAVEDGQQLQTASINLVIDASDATSTAVCVASRFELLVETNPVAGWFRTQ